MKNKLEKAIRLHVAGELSQAEELYREILKIDPNNSNASHNLGVIAVSVNKIDLALPFFKCALESNPNEEQFWLSYIDSLIKTAQIDTARSILNQGKEFGLHANKLNIHFANSLYQIQSNEDLYWVAIQLRESGCYNEAVNWLQNHLIHNPNDADAYAHLAQNYSFLKKDEQAQIAINRAMAINNNSTLVKRNQAKLLLKQQNIQQAKSIALDIYQSDTSNIENQVTLASILVANNELEQAKKLSEHVLQEQPNCTEAMLILGQIFWKAGDTLKALPFLEKAIYIKPFLTFLYPIVSTFLYENKNLNAAIAYLKKALKYEPDNVSIMVTLGEYFRLNYQITESILLLERSVELDPLNSLAWANLGTVLHKNRQFEQALLAYEKAISINPKQPEIYNNLAALMIESGYYETALEYLDIALEAMPNNPDFLASKGHILLKIKSPPQEIELIGKKILELSPESDAGFRLLAELSKQLGEIDQACNLLIEAVNRMPFSAENHLLLGSLLLESERTEEALTSFKMALKLNPDNINALQSIIFLHNYRANITSSEYRLSEAKYFGELASKKVKHVFSNWQCELKPKRLRIGFVSGDFRKHVVSYFLENTLRELKELNCDLLAYSSFHETDEVTKRLKANFLKWSSIYDLSDESAAHLIYEDRVHILIDLSGHTLHNRLPLFAWKPAPIQVTWLGYFATTGLSTMDYILGDALVTPLEEACSFTEKIWQLPNSYFCFTIPEFSIDITPLPARENGFITFGCFNNLTKMNDDVVNLWAKILLSVPNSKLFLKNKQLNDYILCTKTQERFARYGVESTRLILEGGSPREDLLRSYMRVDIALDPFPYPGGTTTIESLYMAVPVLTLRGNCFLSHVGESIAYNVGQSDWIAIDKEDYISKAVSFSSNISVLDELRQKLRRQVLDSPLTHAQEFSQYFENALWEMWHHYSRS